MDDGKTWDGKTPIISSLEELREIRDLRDLVDGLCKKMNCKREDLISTVQKRSDEVKTEGNG